MYDFVSQNPSLQHIISMLSKANPDQLHIIKLLVSGYLTPSD